MADGRPTLFIVEASTPGLTVNAVCPSFVDTPSLRSSAASGFSFVETCGLAYGASLLADSLPSTRAASRERRGTSSCSLSSGTINP